MKILLVGDSITDMGRDRNSGDQYPFAHGFGYPFIVNSRLCEKDVLNYTLINRGISGNRIVDVYARAKSDIWNIAPDVMSILIGVNDVWHEIEQKNGVEIDRFEKVYRMLIEDTKKALPNVKIMLLEPFVLRGVSTTEKFDQFVQVFEYAKVVKKLAEEYGLIFVPLQEEFDRQAKDVGEETLLYDGVHPTIAGSTLIANEWLKGFAKIEK